MIPSVYIITSLQPRPLKISFAFLVYMFKSNHLPNSFFFQLIVTYLRQKLTDKRCDLLGNNEAVQIVAKHLVDMIIMSYRFDNDLVPERGIGKIFDAVSLVHFYKVLYAFMK